MRRRLPKIMTRDEARAILEQPNTRTATGARDRAALLLMYRAGLRVGEVVGLTTRALQANGAKLVFRGKGDKERVVSLDADTRAALDLWLQQRAKVTGNGGALFCRVKGHTGGQFAGEPGQALTTRAVQGMLKGYAAKALGVERAVQIGCHTLRHSHATELVDEGVNLRVIQERLGHARLAQTEVYTQVSEVAQRAVIDARPGIDEGPAPDAEAEDLAARIAALTDDQRAALRALLA